MDSPGFGISLARHGRLRLLSLLLAVNAICMTAPIAIADDDDDRDGRPSVHTLTVDPLPAVTRGNEIVVQGRARPGQRVLITGGAMPASARADKAGRFQAGVALLGDRDNLLEVSLGAHHHHHEGHHEHGRRNVVRTHIVQDSTAPVLTIQQLADAPVYEASVRLVGTATDAAGSVASVNCGAVAAQLVGTQFTCDVPLQPGPNTIRVWAADPAGNVATIERVITRALPDLPGGAQRIAARLVDLDGDGNVDQVTAELATGIVGIRSGRPDGSFEPQRRLPLAVHPSAIDVADFDADGSQDLLIAEYETGEVAVWLGRPDGTFATGPRLAVGALPSAVLAVDFNGDGRVDIATAHMSGEVRVHLSRADGGFDTQAAVAAGVAPVALAVAALRGDEHLQLLAANFISNDVSVFALDSSARPGVGLRIALGGSHGPLAIGTGDFDGDGILDIVTGNSDTADVTLLTGLGQGTFAAPKAIPAGLQPAALAAIDLTGDRHPDVIVTTQDGADARVVIALYGEPPTVAQPMSQLALLTAPPTLRPHLDLTGLGAVHPDAVRIAVGMPSPFAVPVRRPAPNLPPPLARIGQSFGGAVSDYRQLLGPKGASYPPLMISQRAGASWVRLEADPSYFGPGKLTDFDRMAATVDALLAKGLSVHFVVSDWRYASTWDPATTADFPNARFMADLTRFATTLATKTNRPGARVVYEVWNEPNLLGYFWPKRAGVDEAAAYAKLLATLTEAIHTAAPGSIVLAGGILGFGDGYVEQFLTRYQTARAGHPDALVDRFALHPYPLYSQDIFRKFRHDLDQAGFVGSPIQITETGSWDVDRDWVASWNAGILLRAIEEDVQYINLFSALSPPASTGQQLTGFMDLADTRTQGCVRSAYAPVMEVTGYTCHPSTYALSTFRRVAEGRTYQGALFDSRPFGLPGTVFGDQLSGVHALKFEGPDDVVIAVFSADRYRPDVPGSGRVYSVHFPQQPVFVVGATGDINDPASLPDDSFGYSVSIDRGPLYFFFSKTGTPPAHHITARVVCANGSAPLSGDVQISDTVFPPAPPGGLVFRNEGVSSAGAPVTFTRALPQFFSSVYVMAQVADASGRVLPLRSSTQSGPGAGAVRGALFFKPPTAMAELGPANSGAGSYTLDFLAPAQWCAP